MKLRAGVGEETEEYLGIALDLRALSLDSIRSSVTAMQHKSTKDWQSVTDAMDQSAIGALVSSQSSTVTSSSSSKSDSIKLAISEDYLSLQKGFTWDIPQFAVITGQNGVGKTQLLWYIYRRAQALQRDEHADRGLFPQPPAISGIPQHIEGLYQTTLIDANNLSKIDQDYAEVSQRYQSNIGTKIASPQRTSVRPTAKPVSSSLYTRSHSYAQSVDYTQDNFLQSDNYPAAATSAPLAYFPLLDMIWQVAELDNFLVKSTLVSEEFNRLSEEYSLGIMLKEKFINYDKLWLPDFRLFFTKPDVSEDIEFSHLSSGEKTLITILTNIVQLNVMRRIKDEAASLEANRATDHASYVRGISRGALAERLEKELVPIKCFLLDEVDIHFHPEFTAKFLNVLKKISEISHAASQIPGLKDSGAPRVIMTTHNPTTIALAEELGGEVYIMDRDAGKKARIVHAASKRQAISALTGGKLTVIEDINYVLVENKDDAKFYSMVYLKFLSASFLRSNGTRLIFAPVGVKVVETETLDRLGELVATLSVRDAANKDFQEMASLVKSLKEQNDDGGGCGKVAKRAVVVEYEMNADGNGIIPKTAKEKSEKYEPEMIWGLLDRDKARKSQDTLYAIDVYSFECYLCMPLNLFYLMKNAQDMKKSPFKKELIDTLIEPEGLLDVIEKNTDSLREMLQRLTSEVIRVLHVMISEKLKTDSTNSYLLLLQTGLSASMRPLVLANGLIIDNCPSIFFEGLSNEGRRGHKLEHTLGLVLFDTPKYTNRMHEMIFKSLEKIPAALLPKSLQTTMEGLITSKRAQADDGVSK